MGDWIHIGYEFLHAVDGGLYTLFQVILASSLGAFVGWEREHFSLSTLAGIRTYSAISMGACVFGLVSLHAVGPGHFGVDPTRVAAQVVSGVGFIGTGVIFRDGGSVKGLTTAATLWSCAAIGLAVAFGMYAIAVLSTAVTFLLLHLVHFEWWRRIGRHHREVEEALKREQGTLKQHRIRKPRTSGTNFQSRRHGK